MAGLAERDPALAPELTAALKLVPPAVENDRVSEWQRMVARGRAVSQYRKSHPSSAIEQTARARWAWEADAPERAREEMIRACIVKKVYDPLHDPAGQQEAASPRQRNDNYPRARHILLPRPRRPDSLRASLGPR